MKKYLLLTVLSLVTYTSFSQSTFGMVSYTIPEGWYAKQTGDNTEVLKKGMESTNCKIVFFKPVKIIIDTEPLYTKYRDELVSNSGSGISTPVQKETGPGWISFSGLQNMGARGSAYSVAFYSISDTRQTVFVAAYSTSEGECNHELESILQSIDLTELNAAQSGDKTKKVKPANKKIRILALKSLKALVN